MKKWYRRRMPQPDSRPTGPVSARGAESSGPQAPKAAPGSLGPRLHNTLSYSVAALVLLGLAPYDKPSAWLAVFLWVAHFARRALESLWVHRYSGRPVAPADYIVEYAYYWGFATWIAFGMRSPSWQTPSDVSLVIGVALFTLAECGNAWAHWKLRALRLTTGASERRIPRGGLFERVSCPHYFFEILSWVGFAVFTRVHGAYAFLAVGAVILSSYAFSRHKNYIKEFDGLEGREAYPRSRKALVPFLL